MADAMPEDPAGRVRYADRDRYVAVLLAPAPARDGLFALFALDLELAQIVATTTEPLLGEIRLAWWREQLVRLDSAAAPAQPTLAALSRFALPAGITGASLEPLEDAHLALLLDEHFDAAKLEAHLANRGGVLFAASARLLGGDPDVARRFGRVWALGDFVRRGERPPYLSVTLLESANQRDDLPAAPRALRPLAALARMASIDIGATLAGRAPAPRGSAGRQLRMFATLLTGR